MKSFSKWNPLIKIKTFVSVSVIILFFIAWSPFHFQRLGYVYFKSTIWFRTANQYMMYFSGTKNMKIWYTSSSYSIGILYYLSSTLNPLLYTILSVKYRESFKKVILCRNSRYIDVVSSLLLKCTMHLVILLLASCFCIKLLHLML